jgi:hypothetical protein
MPFKVPTPGARAILNTFAREKQEAEKKAAGSAAAEKSAKDLLREHGKALARAEKPVLGWGMQAGNSTISLDVSPAQACPTVFILIFKVVVVFQLAFLFVKIIDKMLNDYVIFLF